MPGTGQKTHGRWIAPDGTVQQIVSERDEWSTKVNQALTAEGCPKVPVVNDGDVELKLAARMREQGATDRPGNAARDARDQPCAAPGVSGL